MQRPDLSQIPEDVLAYIHHLESQLGQIQIKEKQYRSIEEKNVLDLSEPPTTVNLLTISSAGFIKRTYRHLYARQRRGGMGIFDLELSQNDSPIILTLAVENQSLIMFTNYARAFRLPVSKLKVSPVHNKGEDLSDRFTLEPGEYFVAALPDLATGNIALVSQRGLIRSFRHHLFGEYLKPGTVFFNHRDFGPLAAACWTPGNTDIFLATQKGYAIRFSEKLIPPRGILGMRLGEDDSVVSITPVDDASGVFIISADGKGTIRLMSGFNPNKSPGGSGKVALKTDNLVGGITVDQKDDLFLISHLTKIIRFQASEVPTTEGVVQGVQCISLRGDEVSAAAKSVGII